MRPSSAPLGLLALLAACASTSAGTPGGGPDGGGDGADADPLAPDADPFAPDADPLAPDANPLAPDAAPDPRRGWVQLGGPISSQAGDTSDAQSPVVTTMGGVPIVAYTETGAAGTYVYAARYSEATDSWQPMGAPQRASAASNAVTYDTSLAVVGGTLFAVWPEWSDGEMSIAAGQWGGAAWAQLPMSPLGFGPYSFYPHSSAIDGGDGALWVAWAETADFVNPMRVYVRSFKDGVWSDRGTAMGETANIAALGPELARGGGETYMTWIEDGLRVAKYTPGAGTGWLFLSARVAPPGGQPTDAGSGQLAVDSTGRPVMAFTSSVAGEAAIFIARLEGLTTWQFWVQGLQATSGSIDSFANHAYLGDLALDANDNAYVVWYEVDALGHYGTYVHKCTPAGCAPVGPNFGRIEFDTGDSDASWPRLVIDGAGRPIVTWTEEVAGEARVHVWRYHGDP